MQKEERQKMDVYINSHGANNQNQTIVSQLISQRLATRLEKSLPGKLKTHNRIMTGRNQQEKNNLRIGNSADGQSVLLILKKMEGQNSHSQFRPTTEELYAMDHLKKENPARHSYKISLEVQTLSQVEHKINQLTEERWEGFWDRS